MTASSPTQDLMGQILALAAQEQSLSGNLTAAEGYLLSRIDGATPWRLLREIGGIPPAEVDACLTRWVEEGRIHVVPKSGQERVSAGRHARPGSTPSTPSIDDGLLDERLDLGLPAQRRILEFEACLDRSYHELLGVERGADPRVVKRAYFKLSKEFHPDRYFRREIGHYFQRLERIFKKVLEAHEILSDPDLCQVENHPAQPADTGPDLPEGPEASSGVSPEHSPGTAAATPGPAAPRRISKLERLRQRMPFKIDHAAIEARRAKAVEIFRAAELSLRAGRTKEAEANIRIAITFDPGRAEFKEALGTLRLQAAGARATRLLAASNDRMKESELRELLTLLEDVLLYRPHDPDLNDRAARICLQLGQLEAARDYAETCVARCPEIAAHHTLLGRIHREQGDLDLAMHAFENALRCDADEMEARKALASVRMGRRDAARGEGT